MRRAGPERRTQSAFPGRLLAVLLIAGGSVLVNACSKSSSDDHGDHHAAGGGETASAPFDQQFIDMMAPHHEGAVMMAETAQERAEHPELKAMADDIISAQNQEISQLKTWREQWYGSAETPPVDEMPMLPGMEHDGMMNMVEANEALKTAEPFDRAFIDAMIPHHEMAIDAAEMALKQAEHAEIKTLASGIVEAQQREIEQMKSWRAEWYPEE
ncbi:DUF305 domain-containing protein [Sorangium cellulosum]|uniref:DUF305 domain-containing protein n=2 Tax=Sorangium cellulosum TaxID=56 RepID=A0A150P8M8_SORCE|nr:hypothetical protein SCE1572_46960 [Sorangium cellulosum So0157-2]KYF51951.1 DUF305 domain-containing protein [Sorangium cellulosum]